MKSFSKLTKNFLNNTNQEANLVKDDLKKSKFQNYNSSKDSISNEIYLYDKSDYEKTLRLGSVNEIDNEIKIKSVKSKKLKVKFNDKHYISRSSKNLRKVKKKVGINENKNFNIPLIVNKNFIPKVKLKKFILKINNLEKKSKGLNQLLFCARVAIENFLDVCQTVSSCYQWVENNYLESQIKKVIKEAKLKEKQEEDKKNMEI